MNCGRPRRPLEAPAPAGKVNAMSTLSRRRFLGSSLSAATALSLAPVLAAAQGRKLNVLFIAVDDLRPQLGCYGDKLVKSPNIDKLAARGTVFDRAYCQQAVCSPSRTSLLTGCRPDTTKVYDLETHFRDKIPDVITLPQHFKANGYHAQSVGKVYHGGLDDKASWSVPHTQPRRPGYLVPANRQYVQQRFSEGQQKGLKGKPLQDYARGVSCEAPDAADSDYADGAIADEAIKMLGQVKDKPFFLAVGFLKPHLPFNAPKKYWDLYKREDIPLAANPFTPKDAPRVALSNWGELRAYTDIPKNGPLPDDKARELIHGYLAAVSYMDAQLGRVIDELDRLGLRDNTLIILWGDHGWKLGEHAMWCKHTNYELDTRSPMICSAPGQKAPGRKSAALTEFVDIYPTICELAGLSLPKHLEGASFAPLLDTPDRPWKSAAFSQYPRGGGIMGYAMRTGRYRYVEWRARNGSVTATELYDHQTDPHENQNIADVPENRPIVEKLAQQLKAGWQAARPATA